MHAPLHLQSSVQGRFVFEHLQFLLHPKRGLQPHRTSCLHALQAAGRSDQYGTISCERFSIHPQLLTSGND